MINVYTINDKNTPSLSNPLYQIQYLPRFIISIAYAPHSPPHFPSSLPFSNQIPRRKIQVRTVLNPNPDLENFPKNPCSAKVKDA